MKRSAPDESEDYPLAAYHNQGIPYRIRLGEKEIKMCLTSKSILTWDDLPAYGYAVTPVDQLDLIMTRDANNHVLCLFRRNDCAHWSTNKDIWMHPYLLYYIHHPDPTAAILDIKTPYKLQDNGGKKTKYTTLGGYRENGHRLAWTNYRLGITIYADMRRDDYMARLEKIFLLSQPEALELLPREVISTHIVPSVIC